MLLLYTLQQPEPWPVGSPSSHPWGSSASPACTVGTWPSPRRGSFGPGPPSCGWRRQSWRFHGRSPCRSPQLLRTAGVDLWAAIVCCNQFIREGRGHPSVVKENKMRKFCVRGCWCRWISSLLPKRLPQTDAWACCPWCRGRLPVACSWSWSEQSSHGSCQPRGNNI